MPKRQDVKWIVPIAETRKELIKSISVFTNVPIYEIVDNAIKEYVERLKEGDYKKNLDEMKRKRKEYLKIKKTLDEIKKMRSDYSARIKELGIESSDEELLPEYPISDEL